jgi:GT2 family glycosyltransferase
MKISLLLPVFNHLEYTKAAIRTLDNALRDFKNQITIIIIDDGSSDGTSEWVKTNYKDVVVLSGDGNLWWSGAINSGAEFAINSLNTDYLVLWNNDIKFQDDYFEKLIEIINKSDSKTIIGSKILIDRSNGLVWSMGGYFNPKNGKYFMHGYFKKDCDDYRSIKQVDWLTGMGTIVPKNVVEKIGYWDRKNFPQYHGDSDFTYRAMKNGFKVIVHPELVLINDVKNSGIEHKGSFKRLLQLMTDLRSKSNIHKSFKFYSIHASSPLAYSPLVLNYFKIFGGFFKWKILQFFGINKQKKV